MLKRKAPLKARKSLDRMIGSALVQRASTFKAKPKPMKKRRNSSGERALFLKIWSERPHRCEVCHDPIHEPAAGNFSHLLPKSTYPDYRLDERNIIIKCHPDGCHDLWHQKYDKLQGEPNWGWIVNIYHALKREAHQKPQTKTQ